MKIILQYGSMCKRYLYIVYLFPQSKPGNAALIEKGRTRSSVDAVAQWRCRMTLF